MMTRSRSAAVFAVGLLLIGGAVAWGRWRASSAPPPIVTDDVRRVRAELAEELHPVTLSNCNWVRVGSANDGGYAMCGNLLDGIQTAYSYGIGGNDDWGCQISTSRKVPVHQYDCFNPKSAPCRRGSDLRLNVECVGPRQDKGRWPNVRHARQPDRAQRRHEQEEGREDGHRRRRVAVTAGRA